MSKIKAHIQWAPSVVGPRTDKAPSKRPSTRAGGAGLTPPAPGLLPPVRRDRLAGVEAVVSDLARTAAKQKLGVPRADLRMVRSKLRAAREFSRIGHEDDLTPDQANMFYGQLEHASRLTLANAGHKDLRSRDAQVLHALLLTGKLHNRQQHHNGRGEQPGAPLVYGPHPDEKPAWVSVNVSRRSGKVVSRRIHATPAEALHVDVLAHEGLHLAHGNPPLDHDLPRQGMRDLAASLPHDVAPSEEDLEEDERRADHSARPGNCTP